MNSENSIYDFEITSYDGKTTKLSAYKGQVILIVNVASKCGFAKKMYKNMADILQKYPDLVILLFPCKQFLNQEFSDIQAIKHFIDSYHSGFQLMKFVDVKGKNIHPLFQYLCKNTKGFITNTIKWNFTTFLINRQGKIVKRYSPLDTIKIDDKYLLDSIKT